MTGALLVASALCMFSRNHVTGAMPDHLSIPMDTVPTRLSTETSRGARGHDTQRQNDSTGQENCAVGKTPTSIYRHAAPSGPWPWMDFDEDVLGVPPPPTLPLTHSWCGYPQSLFPNWTKTQVDRCKMLTDCPVGDSTVFKVDVLNDGTFDAKGSEIATIKDRDTDSENKFWERINLPRNKNVRMRAIFVENMTKEVLQILGQRHNVEPFFFSSSTNWIPSRYQENIEPKRGDHITVILPFIRVVDRKTVGSIPLPRQPDPSPSSEEDNQIIDTQSPLYLRSCDKYILQDLLSVHMVRHVESNTIISYHPKLRRTTAKQLYSLINRTGNSVYWSKIFEKSKDPTCLFLCFLWYAMYEWDEVFEILYSHINQLEQLVLNSENIKQTRYLHILQAHLLHYRNLLEDFRKSVLFVRDTANPAMEDSSVTEEERRWSKDILEKETKYLLSEIERLDSQRAMQALRLKNVIDLAFASVNIDDSKYMHQLTVATVRDSAAMKQIAYLTTVFLPANLLANVFSMNVREFNSSGGETLAHYIIAAVCLIVLSIWASVALQVESIFFPPGSPMWRRAGWPVFYAWDMMYNGRFRTKRKT
ncbi:hypothetical protein V8E55_008748, partial [Tylopilus felleus]